jgi:hypothetical protein
VHGADRQGTIEHIAEEGLHAAQGTVAVQHQSQAGLRKISRF